MSIPSCDLIIQTKARADDPRFRVNAVCKRGTKNCVSFAMQHVIPYDE